MTHEQVAGAVAAANAPVHVLESSSMQILYQNGVSRALFGPLTDFSEFEALLEQSQDEGRPRLQNVYRLATRQGPRSFLLDAREMDGRVVHMFKDISDLELGLDDLYRGVHVDPLTKALNRRAFIYSLAREMSRAERYGQIFQLLLLELDQRNEVARLHGPAGLAYVDGTIGGLVRSTIRETDIFGVLEGNTLALALPATDVEGGVWVAERIRRLIQTAALSIEGQHLSVTVCIGIARFRHQDMLQHLLERARDALNRALAVGPNQVRRAP